MVGKLIFKTTMSEINFQNNQVRRADTYVEAFFGRYCKIKFTEVKFPQGSGGTIDEGVNIFKYLGNCRYRDICFFKSSRKPLVRIIIEKTTLVTIQCILNQA